MIFLMEKFEEWSKKKISEINELLFKLRGINFEDRLRTKHSNLTLIPIPEKREEQKLRIEKELKIEGLKNKAIFEIKILESEKQNIIIEELFKIIDYTFKRDENPKEFFETLFVEEIMEVEKNKILEIIKNVDSKEVYTTKSMRSVVEGKFYESLKGTSVLEKGAKIIASISLLEDLIERKEFPRRMGVILDEFYEEEGIWNSLNKDFLNSFLEEINIRKITSKESETQSIINSLKENTRELSERTEIESLLRKLIKYIIIPKIGKDWINKIKNQEVKNYLKNNVKDRMEKDRVGISNNLIDYLDLGNCIRIIDSEWELFENIFIAKKENDLGFISQNDFFGNMDVITAYGNPKEHGRKFDYKDGDEERFKMAVKKVKNCINKVLRDCGTIEEKV